MLYYNEYIVSCFH